MTTIRPVPPRAVSIEPASVCFFCDRDGPGVYLESIKAACICDDCLHAIDRARIALKPGHTARHWLASAEVLRKLKAGLQHSRALTLEQRDAIEDAINLLIQRGKE